MPAHPLELWIGPEASVTRTASGRIDQLEATGFAHRLDDLDRIAELGATAVRLPLLWERLERPDGELDFAWADARVERCRTLGLRPIAGLVHHGSGPPHTELLDPAFAPKLAAFALRMAERYPDIQDWTPVNEPLTTARFAGLYGLWYPGRADDEAFVRALLHEVQATALAMRAIRRHVPQARLVQTEDLGHVAGTPALADQVRYENLRRWLSLDLLFGRVTPAHPMHGWLLGAGAGRGELQALVDDPTPPQIVGLNVYVTSERFLDHRLAAYPPALHGGNGRQSYADTEAVRVHGASFGGFGPRLREAWERYGVPVAVTEVQLGCTREEQMRWLLEAWREARSARADGVDVRAVTAWSAFGACDWDSLLTEPRGHYEPGLFDVRGASPRPTALAAVARELAAGREPSHPVLAVPGWWRREDRYAYHAPEPAAAPPAWPGPPLLVLGGRGTLGQGFARLARRRALPCVLMTRQELDIADGAAVRDALARYRPWAVVNAAGFVRVDDAEHDATQWRANALGPLVLAEACAEAGAQLLTFSSDLVFDGVQRRPYAEPDATRPLNAYGRAKAHAEASLVRHRHVIVARTAAFFGPWDEANFVAVGLRRLREGRDWPAIEAQTVSPTYVPDLVDTSLDLLLDGEHGLWHIANEGAASWHAFACQAAEEAGLPTRDIRRVDAAALGQRALRPPYSALTSARGARLPPLDVALKRYLREAAPAG